MNIVSHWPAEFRALYGGRWPDSYVCFDLETSGYSFDRDVITEIGHVQVEDRKVVARMSMVLDWTGHAIVADHWLRQRMASLAAGMEQAGKPCHITYDRMKEVGVRPEEALAFYRDLFRVFRDKEILFAAHNGYKFDEAMLAHNLAGFGVDPDGFSFGDNGLIDTDCVEKASQIATNPRVHPRPGDTLRSYFHRVAHTRISGVRSNLDDHCARKYRFAVDHGIDPAAMHGAEVDAYCVHVLMEAFRGQIEDAPAPTAARAPWLPLAASGPPRRRRGQRNN